jgi:glutamate-1-semialdehyde aminotransferase
MLCSISCSIQCWSQGVYLPPSAFETWFLCNALTYADIDATVEAVRNFKFSSTAEVITVAAVPAL